MPVAVTWQGTSPNQLLETCKTYGIISKNKSVSKICHERINFVISCCRNGWLFMNWKQHWMLLHLQTGFRQQITWEKHIGSTSHRAKLPQRRRFPNKFNHLSIIIVNLEVSFGPRSLIARCLFCENFVTWADGSSEQIKQQLVTILGSFSKTWKAITFFIP